MKYLIITSVYCFAFSLFARVIYTDYQKQNSINTVRYKDIEISKEKCPNNICLATTVINKSKKELLKKVYVGPGGVNPTSSLCRLVKGTPIIYYLKNKDAISICLFDDASFLISWDFFRYLKSK